MPVEWSDQSYFKKEMARWNAPKREGGENRNGYEEFPRMLYKTQINPLSGRYEVAVARDVISLDKTTTLLDAQAFNASCQVTVKDANEEDRYMRDGWRRSMAEAIQYQIDEVAKLATESAEMAYRDRNMSPAAQAEADKFEASTPQHVAEIPEQRRARKPLSPEHKAKLVAGAAKAREAKVKKSDPVAG